MSNNRGREKPPNSPGATASTPTSSMAASSTANAARKLTPGFKYLCRVLEMKSAMARVCPTSTSCSTPVKSNTRSPKFTTVKLRVVTFTSARNDPGATARDGTAANGRGGLATPAGPSPDNDDDDAVAATMAFARSVTLAGRYESI